MRKLLIGLTLALATSTPAMANCYEGLGCDDSDVFARRDLRQLSCQALWEVRNAIYGQNGYCFKTERALEVFSNSGCYVRDQNRVRLNAIERQNISRIVAVERQKDCD